MNWRLSRYGERALSVVWADQSLEQTVWAEQHSAARMHALCTHLRAELGHRLEDAVPGVRHLTLVLRTAPQDWPALEQRVLAGLHTAGHASTPAATLRLPVCYDPALGNDLAAVCVHTGLTVEQIIARHCAAEYTVLMLGFLPGFAYLGGLPEALHTPRKATPALKVPAGSVAIAHGQCAVYPLDSPGGWHVLGHTSVPMLDWTRAQLTTLQPCMRVRFEAVDLERHRSWLDGPRA